MTDTFFNLLDMVYPSLSRQNNFNMLNFVSDVDDCFVGPCSNGGNCTDLVDDFHCSCAAGWTGKQCTTSKFSYPNKIIHCHNYQLLITITKNWPTKKIVGAIRRVYRTNKSNSYLDLLNSLKSKRTYFIGLKTLLRQIWPTKNPSIKFWKLNQETNILCDKWNANIKFTTIGPVNSKFHGERKMVRITEVKISSTALQREWILLRISGDFELSEFELSGSNCTEFLFFSDVNECSPSRCRNGGRCFDLVNNYLCMCADGWTGKNCTTG